MNHCCFDSSSLFLTNLHDLIGAVTKNATHHHPQSPRQAGILSFAMITSPLMDQSPLLYSGTPTKFLSKYQIVLPSAIASLSSHDEETVLGDGYKPTDFDVVCGRGKGSYNKPGNRRFRAIVKEHIPEYLATRTKFDKSNVLNKIIDVIREKGHFVKKDKNGAWYEINDDQAREKVGHTIRESIAAMDSTLAKPKTKKVVENTQDEGDLLSQQEHQAIYDEIMEAPTPISSDFAPVPSSIPIPTPRETARQWQDMFDDFDNFTSV